MILSNVTTGAVTVTQASNDVGIRSPAPCAPRVPHLREFGVFVVFLV
jgi:hypothetical protein